MIERLSKLLAPSRPEPAQQARRIVAMQLHIVLPAKIGIAAIAIYYLFSGWFSETANTYIVVIQTLQEYFFIYLLCNLFSSLIFIFQNRFPPGLMQWLVFTLGLLDGLFVAGLTFIAGGFGSIAYWIFPALIVLNAISIPLAMPQIVLNLSLSVFYLSAGILAENTPMEELWVPQVKAHWPGTTNVANTFSGNSRHLQNGNPANPVSNPDADDVSIDSVYSRLFVLWLLTACCYGVQLLVARQRETMAELREFAMREGQLHSAGRLAAEFAHQIKNPLAIINNAAFSLRRVLHDNNSGAQQIQIIQEEVARADRVITQIMGYAQLSEGRVEKLNVIEELNRAITQVFPPAVPTKIKIHREFASYFPPLLMQRGHLSEILVNLLQNAREALGEKGNIFISVNFRGNESIEISMRDDGPGIPLDKIKRIFEAYYSTKEKGTGLGLAIVKHNVELYSGQVQVDSEIGIGAQFVVIFPAKSVLNERL